MPDSFRFIYYNDFIINITDAIPTIDLNIDYIDFENIPAIFEDNLPEGINKDIVEIQNKAIDDFEMLSIFNENGKVFFAPLYDIACTGVYDRTKHLDSTLTINGKNKNIRPNDFKDFKKEVFSMSRVYQLKLPLYIKELKKQIGFIPFYKSKLKKRSGNEPEWVRENDAIDFCEVLFLFHQKRVNQLKELGWILDN